MEPFWDYWRARAKESLVKARVRADAAIFLAVIIFGLVGLWFSKFPVDTTVWWTGFVVFAGWLLIEICFVSPYKHAQKLASERDKLQQQIDWHNDAQRIKREAARQHVFEEASCRLKGAEAKPAEFFMSFHGLFVAGAADLETNDDLIWVCDKLAEQHDHPFEGLEQCVHKDEWLQFMQWGKHHRNLLFSSNADYLKGAEKWAVARGRDPWLPLKTGVMRHMFDK